MSSRQTDRSTSPLARRREKNRLAQSIDADLRRFARDAGGGWRVIVYGPNGDTSSSDYGEHDIRFDRTFADLAELSAAGLSGIAEHEAAALVERARTIRESRDADS